MTDRAVAPARPESAVSEATGLVGLAAFIGVLALFLGKGVTPGLPALLLISALIWSMAIWSIVTEKVHLRPSTGLDFSAPRPTDEVWATTWIKLAGLFATYAAIFVIYFSVRTYAHPNYELYFNFLLGLAPLILLGSFAYVLTVDRYMCEPHDALWHAGRWVLRRGDADPEMLAEHVRAWAIKGFFLAFMFSEFPGQITYVLENVPEYLADPRAVAVWAIGLLFLIDLAYALIGYVVTSRLFDAHIRSCNPHLSAWVYALVCYPPFLVMGYGGPLGYRTNVTWADWLAGNEVALALWGGILVALTMLYAWATVIFGLRFSNLTHRGIITNGPFRFFKHPAYLSKNIFWWLVAVPFVAPDAPMEALRNCLMLLGVNFIYLMRARTEERHLMEDPDYRNYAAWIARNGVLPRLTRAVLGD